MQKRILFVIFTIALLLAGVLSLESIHKMQGNARTVNYAGVVRGATQMLVKQEMNGQQNDELIEKLDGILEGLQTGNGEYGLTKLEDSDFQNQLEQIQADWKEMKKEISSVRNGSEQASLFELSEQYFRECDDAVCLAEAYSEKQVTAAISHLVLLIVSCILLAAFVGFISARISRRQNEMDKLEEENARMNT